MTDEQVIELVKLIKDQDYNSVISALSKAGISTDGHSGDFDPEHPLNGARWSDDDKCYIGLDGKKYDEDGEELVEGMHAHDFDDIRFRRLQSRFGYNKAVEMMKSGK